MARHDVTRGEFRRYWAAGGSAAFAGKDPSCRDRESIFRSSKKRNWENPDIAQDDNHPVVCVGWQEAAAYAQWLGKQTGKHYRLPSPAEFDRVPRERRRTGNARRIWPMPRSSVSSTAARAAIATTDSPQPRRWAISSRSPASMTSMATCASGSARAAAVRPPSPAAIAVISSSRAAAGCPQRPRKPATFSDHVMLRMWG